MRPLVLVGLMGSGKSTVGALVAERSGRKFVDVDVVITARMSKTVRELWEEGGEAAYRYLESDVVLEVLRDDTPTVLAAPGGAVLDPVVRAALADCVVVWLRTSPSTLAGRVRPGDHRPLLGDEPADTFAAMAEMRSELYRQVATAILDTDELAPETIADVVLGLLGSSPADA
jgi:shikimate kinase